MANEEHRAEITSGELTDALASVMGEASPYIAWNRRVGRIRVGGVPLNEQRARFKRPDDVIFHKETHEVLMGADMISALGLDEEIENITSRDKPDLILHFQNGIDIYADYTRACVDFDEANDEAIRSVNRRLRRDLSANQPLDSNGGPLTPHITLRCRPTQEIRTDALLDEILAFVCDFDSQYSLMGSFGPETSLLAALGATFWWNQSRIDSSWNVVAAMFESRDLASLVATVEKRIAEKTGRYPQRPLWLLISISESWANRMGDGAHVDFSRAVGEGSLRFDLGDFDRIAVGVTGHSVWLQSKNLPSDT